MSNRDPVTTWPARYQASTIQIHESTTHRIWISSTEVRKVLPSLRSDNRLQKEHGSDFRALDRTPRLFFSEAALRREIGYLRSQDALKFMAWLEKAVIYPATRKRDGSPALAVMLAKPRPPGLESAGESPEDLHVPLIKLLPRHKPVPIHRRGELEPAQSGAESYFATPIIRMWRGEERLRHTVFLGGAAMLGWTLLIWALTYITVHPAHYSGSYAMRQWVAVLLLAVSPIGVVWWCVGMMRCSLRRQGEGRSFFVSVSAFLVGVFMLIQSVSLTFSIASEWIAGWWDTVNDNLRVSEVIHDPVLGRIVVRGEIGFGSYAALQAALTKRPKLTLVEVEGPGGYVYEGLEMARLIQSQHLDTVTLEQCASACTLLFAAGQERYLGPQARVGFHRSGARNLGLSSSWTSTDHQIADFYQSRAASDAFITEALDTPFSSMWYPEHGSMFTAGYATKRWDERKSGY